MKRFCLLLFLVATLGAQVLVNDLADITGDGSAHRLTSTPTAAMVVIIVCQSGNSAVVRIGGPNISSSRGIPCAAGGSVTYPVVNPGTPRWDLSKIWYRAANGDKISVSYGY